MNDFGFNITIVERDTGLSKDVLRMWERRYGFPQPDRDARGDRIYPADQVERLRLIKRLMDQGHRPGQLIAMSAEALGALAPRRAPARVQENDEDAATLDELLALIRRHDATGFQQAMQQRLARQGLQRFVQDTVASLVLRVGEAWEKGGLAIFEEHLFTELTQRTLRQAMTALPASARSPRIVLATVPEEQHVLGLLMIEALLALEGAECIPLGAQTPLLDISRAARAHQADVVALSFSGAFPPRQNPGLLQQLRRLVPPEVAIWAGGAGVARLAKIDGVLLLTTLNDGIAALAHWRAERV